VERAYWELYAAERDAAVETAVRDGAAALEESAERRARAGLVGPNQVANARVFLAVQDVAVLDAGEGRGTASDRLGVLIGRRPDAGVEHFRTTDEPPREFVLAAQDSVVDLALRDNLTLRMLAGLIEAEGERERAASWDALPTLDLVGSLGGNGLAGNGQTVVFGPDTLRTDLHTGWGDSWSQVFQGDFPTWSAGVLFRYPFGRREGTGERDRVHAVRMIAEQELEAARRSLEEVVRRRHRELENANDRLRFTKAGVDAAFEQTRIGRLEFENGRTTAFELVRVAGDLAEAQRRYSQALVRAATAAAELRELTAGGYPRLPTP
jgi:outer membrane protein TolC